MFKQTHNEDDQIHLDLPANVAYFPQITQNSDVVFLADKVWQGGAQSSVDMNRFAKQYNSKRISAGLDEIGEIGSDKIFLNNLIEEQAEQESKISESVNEEYANFLKDSQSTIRN